MTFPMHTPASAEHFADFRGFRSSSGLLAGVPNQPEVIREPHGQKNREGPTAQGRPRLILNQWCLIAAFEDTGSSLHNSYCKKPVLWSTHLF